jgi:arylsulfatase A-like enzyme
LGRLPAGPRPNILFVVYDARRRDDFSFGPHGNSRNDTPFLASLEKKAISFEDAVSPGTWTAPVHAAMFSGLSVCDLGNDLFSPAWATFPDHFLSLAEILSLAGYETIAFPDHPFFYRFESESEVQRRSLLRGFEKYSVVNDFGRFGVRTNLGTSARRGEMHFPLELPPIRSSELAQRIRGVNAGAKSARAGAAGDFDASRGMHFAPITDLFARSSYLKRRYLDAFDRHVFTTPAARPYFLFLNLHMATTVAVPDPHLYASWLVESLALNATARGRKLPEWPNPPATPEAWLEQAFRTLDLRHDGFPDAARFMKQVFDNRFYDASFRGVVEYLEARGRLDNTAILVTSDHGMSFGEHGERFYRHDGARPYEYITRVPLILRLPEASPAASLHGRYPQAVSLTDVFSTVLEIALGPGVFTRELPIRGRSLLERIRRKAFDPVLVSEGMAAPDGYRVEPEAAGHAKAVYQGRSKLILLPDPWRVRNPYWPSNVPLHQAFPEKGQAPTNERLGREVGLLFDLAADPHETRDLAPSDAPTVAALKKAVAEGWGCRPLGAGTGRANLSADWDESAIETLRALGYVN